MVVLRECVTRLAPQTALIAVLSRRLIRGSEPPWKASVTSSIWLSHWTIFLVLLTPWSCAHVSARLYAIRLPLKRTFNIPPDVRT
jgi:hypothetical protein